MHLMEIVFTFKSLTATHVGVLLTIIMPTRCLCVFCALKVLNDPKTATTASLLTGFDSLEYQTPAYPSNSSDKNMDRPEENSQTIGNWNRRQQESLTEAVTSKAYSVLEDSIADLKADVHRLRVELRNAAQDVSELVCCNFVTNKFSRFQTSARVQSLREELDDLNAVVQSMAVQNKVCFSTSGCSEKNEEKEKQISDLNEETKPLESMASGEKIFKSVLYVARP